MLLVLSQNSFFLASGPSYAPFFWYLDSSFFDACSIERPSALVSKQLKVAFIARIDSVSSVWKSRILCTQFSNRRTFIICGHFIMTSFITERVLFVSATSYKKSKQTNDFHMYFSCFGLDSTVIKCSLSTFYYYRKGICSKCSAVSLCGEELVASYGHHINSIFCLCQLMYWQALPHSYDLYQAGLFLEQNS